MPPVFCAVFKKQDRFLLHAWTVILSVLSHIAEMTDASHCARHWLRLGLTKFLLI
jgi:hypothetical protein